MNESKELLEATIKGLEEKLKSVTDDLNTKNRELVDINKPIMTNEMFDNIHELVEDGIGNFDFNDSNNYEIEYELDYDGRVNAHSIELNDTHYLAESIMNKIDSHYKIIETVNPTESTSG